MSANLPDLPIHPIAKLFPPLPPDELVELERDINQHGVRQAIVLYQGQILDGVNRYQIARKLGKDCPTVELDPSASPWDIVKSLNLRRRHMTAEQRVAVVLKAEKMLPELQRAKEDALRRKLAGTSAAGEAKGKAAAKIADTVGVSAATVERVQQAAKADPASLDRIISGETTSSRVVKPTPTRATPTKPTATTGDVDRVRADAQKTLRFVEAALATFARLAKTQPRLIARYLRRLARSLRQLQEALAEAQRRAVGGAEKPTGTRRRRHRTRGPQRFQRRKRA